MHSLIELSRGETPCFSVSQLNTFFPSEATMILLYFLLGTIWAANPEDRCLETVDPGPCQVYQMKWFWDETDGQCKEFHYGGCLGNKNRFNTKQECMKMCRYKLFNPVAVPDLCLLEVDHGHCQDERMGQWWFWFNSDSGECEKFFYYGCGGNDNKFYSLHLCRKVCGERLSPQIACDQCDLRTSYCKSHSKYNYTCECRVGFQGNAQGECVDIEECRGFTAVCDKNAWCTNTIGGYQCECMAAYRGDGKTCTYVGLGRSTIDCGECSSNATCNSGVCQCKKGFQGDGFNCTDVNECLRSPYVCDKNAECHNTDGGFICECLDGWAGNGYNCTKEKNSCLDKFDRGYETTCGGESWREHYYFDHQAKRCALFWYDGCDGRSRNIFSTIRTCEQLCEETNVLTRAEICWDKFDMNYRNQCLNGRWEPRFYFDHASLTCRQFWYDGCRSDSRNLFDDMLTCEWLCEAQPMYKSKACLEDFDPRFKDSCMGGRWRQQWYFDKANKQCVPFWYDGCKGEGGNLFQDEQSCLITCEHPAKKDPAKPWHKGDKKKMKEVVGPNLVFKPNSSNICETANPCQNKATCHFSHRKNSYHCRCAQGWTGRNCSEQADFDPCSSNPCHNGATCQAKTEKGTTIFECYCAKDFGGPSCDQKPCEKNPCHNNGTCRTTRSLELYFCDCLPGFGGRDCDVAIGQSPPETFGKNVEMVSSGRAEWVNEMKNRFAQRKKGSGKSDGKEEKEKEKTNSDQPYKDPIETKYVPNEMGKEENLEMKDSTNDAENPGSQNPPNESPPPNGSNQTAKMDENLAKNPRILSYFLVFLLARLL